MSFLDSFSEMINNQMVNNFVGWNQMQEASFGLFFDDPSRGYLDMPPPGGYAKVTHTDLEHAREKRMHTASIQSEITTHLDTYAPGQSAFDITWMRIPEASRTGIINAALRKTCIDDDCSSGRQFAPEVRISRLALGQIGRASCRERVS